MTDLEANSRKKYIQKKQVIVIITCFFWIFTKLFSFKLWHADRLYPLVPPFRFLENIPNYIHLGLFWSALFGLFLIAFNQKNKVLIAITLTIEFCSCLLDQNRWQPYQYQYFITILFLLCYQKNSKQFLNYFSFLIIIIYINSGLHKFTGAFLYSVWETMILHRFFGLEKASIDSLFIHYSGLSLGFLEFVAAIGLLFSRYKKIAALLLIGMHLFILLLISPTGLNYNSIVWPWNVAMILFLYLLFCRESENYISWKDLLKGYNKIHLFYLGILPIFCFFGWYDNFLSFNLYSGTLKRLEICIENKEKATKYEQFIKNKSWFCKSGSVIKVNDWSLKEMNIVTYPEDRFLFGVIKKFKVRNPEIEATYIITQYPYQEKNTKYYK